MIVFVRGAKVEEGGYGRWMMWWWWMYVSCLDGWMDDGWVGLALGVEALSR